MIHLTINADDFGFDENRTKAILESFRIGAITRTTAMVNMPYFETAVGQIRKTGFFNRMGLHLNLTEGPALTEAMRQCRFFCDEHGCFTAVFHRSIKSRIWLPKDVQEIAKREIEAQLKKFVDCGVTCLHLDSHHHVHTDLSVARLVIPLAARYGFRTVRLSRNWGAGLSWTKRAYKFFLNRFVLGRLGGASDFFTDFRGFKDGFAKLRDGCSVEVMVHPMYGDRKTGLSLVAPLTDSGRKIVVEQEFYTSIRDSVVFQ